MLAKHDRHGHTCWASTKEQLGLTVLPRQLLGGCGNEVPQPCPVHPTLVGEENAMRAALLHSQHPPSACRQIEATQWDGHPITLLTRQVQQLCLTSGQGKPSRSMAHEDSMLSAC